MKLKKRYVDINDTLKHIRVQVLHSIPYARKNVPVFSDPWELWRWLNDRLIYKNDPPNVELLQSFKTLIQDNYHGIPGAGDCDCFTIAFLTVASVQGWGCPLWIKLAGREKDAPVHIWGGLTWKGKDIPLDFTEKRPEKERYYPYVQKINFDTSK